MYQVSWSRGQFFKDPVPGQCLPYVCTHWGGLPHVMFPLEVELSCYAKAGRDWWWADIFLSPICVSESSCLCFSILKAHPLRIYITECSQGILSHQSLEKGLTPTLVHWFSVSKPRPTDKTQHKLSYRLRAIYKTLLRAEGNLLKDFLGYYHF